MIKQLLNLQLAIEKYCDLSVSRGSVICRSHLPKPKNHWSVRHWSTHLNHDFAQPRPIIVNYSAASNDTIRFNYKYLHVEKTKILPRFPKALKLLSKTPPACAWDFNFWVTTFIMWFVLFLRVLRRISAITSKLLPDGLWGKGIRTKINAGEIPFLLKLRVVQNKRLFSKFSCLLGLAQVVQIIPLSQSNKGRDRRKTSSHWE